MQFLHSGSPGVITDGAIRQKTKFPIFSSDGTICLSRVVLETASKRIAARPSRDQKSRFRSSSAAIAEPNAENRVKIRPVEVEIIVLTELTLSGRQVSGDKYPARSGANAVPCSKRTKRLVRLLIDIHVGSAAA